MKNKAQDPADNDGNEIIGKLRYLHGINGQMNFGVKVLGTFVNLNSTKVKLVSNDKRTAPLIGRLRELEGTV